MNDDEPPWAAEHRTLARRHRDWANRDFDSVRDDVLLRARRSCPDLETRNALVLSMPAPIRTCNITPGGHVCVGPQDDRWVTMHVTNFYTGERPTLVNLENRLIVSVGDDYAPVIDQPITRDECYEIAEAFLRMARDDRHWSTTAIERPELPV